MRQVASISTSSPKRLNAWDLTPSVGSIPMSSLKYVHDYLADFEPPPSV